MVMYHTSVILGVLGHSPAGVYGLIGACRSQVLTNRESFDPVVAWCLTGVVCLQMAMDIYITEYSSSTVFLVVKCEQKNTHGDTHQHFNAPNQLKLPIIFAVILRCQPFCGYISSPPHNPHNMHLGTESDSRHKIKWLRLLE